LWQRLRGTWVAAVEQREAAIGNAVAAKPELAVCQAECVAWVATATRVDRSLAVAWQRLQGALTAMGFLAKPVTQLESFDHCPARAVAPVFA
ncbi:hypothetical protein, partial [Pseudomonas chlororaphis]|uniref:hypothetical protein n=1 Tax=Pseudomonas chlororaphis TaxID=587753 RepID=UPI003C1624ED